MLRPTVSRPVCLGVVQYCLAVRVLFLWGALSDERTGLSLYMLPLGLATIFYCLRFETSLSVASYDSQGHGGGIRHRLHTGYCRHNAEHFNVTEGGTHTNHYALNAGHYPTIGWKSNRSAKQQAVLLTSPGGSRHLPRCEAPRRAEGAPRSRGQGPASCQPPRGHQGRGGHLQQATHIHMRTEPTNITGHPRTTQFPPPLSFQFLPVIE
jgi:hypothetical protein